MKVQIAHPITSYFDATSQLLKAQGEDFQLAGATSLTQVLESSAQNREDVYVIDSIMLRDEPGETFKKLAAMSRQVPAIVMIEENEEALAEELRNCGPFTLLYKRKGYLTALAEAIRQSYSEHLKRLEAARAEALKAETLRAEAARAEALRLDALKAEALKAEALKKAESTRAAAEQRQRLTMETAPTPAATQEPAEEGFFICDRRGRFLSANKILQTMLNYTEDELLELSLADLLSREEETRLFNEIFADMGTRESFPVQLQFIDKVGTRRPVNLKIRMLRDESKEKRIIGFRGSVTLMAPRLMETGLPASPVDQQIMIHDLMDLVQMSYTEPLNVLLKRIGEVVCQVFGFQRATVAILDRRKKAYVKQAMIGYGQSGDSAGESRILEVPQDLLDRLFIDREPVKVIYYNQESRSAHAGLDALDTTAALIRQPEMPAETQWHPRDLVLLRLADHRGQQFGYISIDEPLDSVAPSRALFFNLELFSQMAAMVIENYYRFSTIERRSRRLKQILINSNIFKLYLSLNELLKEVVWAVKFSLEFNLVSLVLISKKSGQLETKAVACDDRIKLGQIHDLAFDLKDFSGLLREEYRRGRSFLISSEEKVLQHLKQIYYGSFTNGHYIDGWPRYALLLVPIKSREGKIIGFILADDPADGRLPTTESVQILEILANQVAIAIDNRMLYVQSREKPQTAIPPEEPAPAPATEEYPEENSSGLRRLVDRFLR
ncbi:MAG TPA: PAS domain-containing protein [bacterium]|nr:PAS domain-containing protein [bacterium]HQI48807.1 PAS domain-containing protein [bacterium]HQJ66059.1 PAS domain-containing protein [bacterium]